MSAHYSYHAPFDKSSIRQNYSRSLPKAAGLPFSRQTPPGDLQGVREQEKTFARFHLVIIPPGRLKIFDSDLLMSNVLFQLAHVLLGLDKLKFFRVVLHLPTPHRAWRNDARQFELITILSQPHKEH